MTEETPLHNALKPSVADIRLNAFPMPVYIAAGDAVKTCIRVCEGNTRDEWGWVMRHVESLL